MAKGVLRCYHCQFSFKFYSAHAGFGDEIFFYCDLCGAVACIDFYRKEYNHFCEKHGLRRPYAKHEIPLFAKRFKNMKIEIAQNLAPCACGGRFATNAIPRCPTCNKALQWKDMVDVIDEASESFTPHYFRKFVKKGWRDIYYFVFNDRLIRNNWNSGAINQFQEERCRPNK